MKYTVDQRRVYSINNNTFLDGPIIYWMSRDQRVHDNWALLYAQQVATSRNVELIVIFALKPNLLEATIRQYGFMLRGLEEVESKLKKLNIHFHLLLGEPVETVTTFVSKHEAGALVTDFDPLRIKQQWQNEVSKKISCAFYEVDAHNIVPCRIASPKQEFGAYTIRPKIQRVIKEYLVPFPLVKKQDFFATTSKNNWKAARESLKVDLKVPEVTWCLPGEKAGRRALKNLIEDRLSNYSQNRNDPNKNAQSNLSPYLHFGNLSAQRVALEIMKTGSHGKNTQDFLEELIIRKELSDNFCFYNKKYDSKECFPDWAKKTLSDHGKDKRPYLYTIEQFEKAETHDPLWNAAQLEMKMTGKMHGYMRMYWAKKILEWTKSVDEALRYAIYLNDKYELDGRDPNGYVGIAWSIGGVHDRAWFDRPVFGKIRYMSYNGCKSKFDIETYIKKYGDTIKN
ncbi:MAG: deoxyribodipyrimidine photo-lyase [Candidatus Paceibacterota bacterium]